MCLNDTVVFTASSDSVFRYHQLVWDSFSAGLPPDARLYTIENIADTPYIGTDRGLYAANPGFPDNWPRLVLQRSRTGSVYALLDLPNMAVVGCDSGVWVSTDAGSNWTWTNVGAPVIALGGKGDTVYACLWSNVDTARILKSIDAAATWSLVTYVGLGAQPVHAFHVADSAIIVGSAAGMFRLKTGDAAWSRVSKLDGGTGEVRDFLEDNGILFAGANDGFMTSTNDGESWIFLNDGLPVGTRVNTVRIRNGEVYICTDSSWVWARQLKELLAPHVAITDSGKVHCQGDSVMLRLRITGLFPVDAIRTSTGRIVDSVTVWGKAGDTIIVTVVDVRGGVGNDSLVIPMVPSADAGKNTAICPGQIVQLGSPDNRPGVYEWSPSVGLDDSTSPRPLASPTTTTTYRMNVTDLFTGCVGYDSVQIVVPNASGKHTQVPMCAGSPIVIGDEALPGMAYRWHRARGLAESDRDIARPTVRPDVTTTYIVDVTDSTGCIATDSVTVTVRGAPRHYVMRVARDTLVAWPGGALAWYRNGEPIAGAVDTLTGLLDGVYTYTAVGSDGGIDTSRSRAVRIGDPLFMPDLHVPFCALGYEKRRIVMMTNDGATTLVIDSVHIVSDDPDGCDTLSRFRLRNPLNGIELRPKDAVPAFIGYIPVGIDTNSVNIVVDYTVHDAGKTKHRSFSSATGVSSDDANVVSADVRLDDIESVSSGQATHLRIRVDGRDNTSGALKKAFEVNGGCIPYRIQLWLSSSALLHIGNHPPTSFCDVGLIKIRGYPRNKGLWIDYFGVYDAMASYNADFPCMAMLGDVEQTDVIVGTFQWMAPGELDTTAETYLNTVTFRLDGICRDNGHPRLVEAVLPAKAIVKLAVSPNLVDRMLSFTYDLSNSGPASFALYDMFGRIVNRADLGSATAGINRAECHVGALPNGSYFVRLSSGDGYAVARFEIER